MVDVHAASVQDRDGAPAVIMALLEVAVCVERLFADSGYAGPKLQDALKELGVSELIEIVPKPKGAKGFTVLSRRWVVERTFAWMVSAAQKMGHLILPKTGHLSVPLTPTPFEH